MTNQPRQFWINGTMTWSEDDFSIIKEQKYVDEIKNKSIHVIEAKPVLEKIARLEAALKNIIAHDSETDAETGVTTYYNCAEYAKEALEGR